MTLSAKIQENILKCLADGAPHSVQEIKSFLEKEGVSDYSEGQFSGSINTLLRNSSIKKKERGVYLKKDCSAEGDFMKECFVVSPVGEEGSEVRINADKLYKYIIMPVCEDCGFRPVRADRINNSDSITKTIIDKLISAELVIADITGHNPNVFYEIGYRNCLEKPIIHLRKKGEQIPFDLNAIRTFEYDLTDLDNVEEIKNRLKQTIESFSFESQNDISLDEETNKQSFSQGLLTLLYQIQDSVNELQQQVNKRDMEMIQAIMQTSLNNAKKEETMDVVVTKTLLPELIKNPDLMQNLMRFVELSKTIKK